MELTNLQTWLQARKAQDEHLCAVLTHLLKNEEPLKLALLSAPGFFKGETKLSLLGGSITESMFNIARNVHHHSQFYVQKAIDACIAAVAAKDEQKIAKELYRLMIFMRPQQSSLETSGMITIAVRNLRPKIKAAADAAWESYFERQAETPKDHPLKTMKGFSMLLIGYRQSTQTLFEFDENDPSPITEVLKAYRRENIHDQRGFEFNMRHVMQCFEVGQQVLGELYDLPACIKEVITFCAAHPYIPAYLEMQGFNSGHVSKLKGDIKDFVLNWAKEVVAICQLDIARRGVLATEVSEIQPELYEKTEEARVMHLDAFEAGYKAFKVKYESSALTLGLIQAMHQACLFFSSSELDPKMKTNLDLIGQFLLSVESSLIEPNYADTMEGLLGERSVYALLRKTEEDAKILYEARVENFHKSLGAPNQTVMMGHIKTDMKKRLVVYAAEDKIAAELMGSSEPPNEKELQLLIATHMQTYFFKSQSAEYQEWIDRLNTYKKSEDLFFKGKHHRLACFVQTMLNLGHRPAISAMGKKAMEALSLENLDLAEIEIIPDHMILLIEPKAAFQLILDFGLFPKFTIKDYGFCAFEEYPEVKLTLHALPIMAKQFNICYASYFKPTLDANTKLNLQRLIRTKPMDATLSIDGLDFQTALARFKYAASYGFLPKFNNRAKESLNEIFTKRYHDQTLIEVNEYSEPSPILVINNLIQEGLIPKLPKNSLKLVMHISQLKPELRQIFISHTDGLQAIKLFNACIHLGLAPSFETSVLTLINETMLTEKEICIDFPSAIYATLFKTVRLNSPLLILKKIVEAGLRPGKMDHDTKWLFKKELQENLANLKKHSPNALVIDIIATKVEYSKIAFENYKILLDFKIPTEMINISTQSSLVLREYVKKQETPPTYHLITDDPILAIKVAEHGFLNGLKITYDAKTIKAIEKAIKSEGGKGIIFKRYNMLKQNLSM